jgi:hypothetical protein
LKADTCPANQGIVRLLLDAKVQYHDNKSLPPDAKMMCLRAEIWFILKHYSASKYFAAFNSTYLGYPNNKISGDARLRYGGEHFQHLL